MERQKQNGMVWAQNPIISQNDWSRKNHIDNGEGPAATLNDRGGQSTIYQIFLAVEVTHYTVVLVSLSSARPFPRYHSWYFYTQQRRKRLIITTKHANWLKSGLTTTVNTGRLRKTINNLLRYRYSLDHEGHEYVSVIIVAALQNKQSTPKILHVNRTWLTKPTVLPLYSFCIKNKFTLRRPSFFRVGLS